MLPALDIHIGHRFGRLTITSERFSLLSKNGKRFRTYYRCVCDCGNHTQQERSKLSSGYIVSCGCVKRTRLGIFNRKHKYIHKLLFSIHAEIIARCRDKKHKAYYWYGGRGITICNEWLDFDTFYEWSISHGYRKGLTIDRRNNQGKYEPSNCRWITQCEQMFNIRTNHNITAWGELKCASEWSRDIRCMVCPRTFKDRIKRGWTPEKAIGTPPINRNGSLYQHPGFKPCPEPKTRNN